MDDVFIVNQCDLTPFTWLITTLSLFHLHIQVRRDSQRIALIPSEGFAQSGSGATISADIVFRRPEDIFRQTR